MAARKLQTEIDRTLKKVSEGVEQFEQLYEKMQNSSNQTQKEKMEADLKTQIKKLQRLRDQIKTWQQSNEIKDKKALNDGRKAIETQMERFKATEKEMKTKAFSKEGLIAAARLDPAEKAKVEMASWISSQVDELSRQIESSEAEIEQVQAGTGKKKKAGGASAERTAGLEQLNERRAWHVGRLEILHRMLENGTLEPERVGEIKDDITYFVDSNADDEFEEDEGIYDDFDLDEQEEAFGLKADDDTQDDDDQVSAADESSISVAPPSKAPAKEAPKHEPTKKEEKKPTPSISTRKISDATRGPPTGPSAASDGKAVPPANFAAAKQASSSPTHVTSPTKPTAPAASTLPPIRYAAAAAAAVGSTSAAAPAAAPAVSPVVSSSTANTAPSTAAPISALPLPTAPSEAVVEKSPASSAPSAPSEPAATASPAPSHAPSQLTSISGEEPSSGPSVPPGLIRTQSPAVNGSSKASPSLTHSSLRRQSIAQGSPIAENAGAPGLRADGSSSNLAFGQLPSPSAQRSTSQAPFPAASLAGNSGAAAAVQPTGGAVAAQKPSEARLPSSLADLVSSFESAKVKSLHRDENMPTLHKSLESSFMNVPEPLDSEKPKYYIPKNPYATPGYYPQTPTPIFDSPSIYSKFDEDTLFYIFYYQQGTYHQFLAAKELKKQSWRFHKQFLTWFRRHSEPQAITDEYEQGVYVYFDWEGSWAQRKKSDFRFEYRWLED